jgi:hypothetical protein
MAIGKNSYPSIKLCKAYIAPSEITVYFIIFSIVTRFGRRIYICPGKNPPGENPCPASQAPSLFILPFKPLLPLPGGQSHVGQESSSWKGAY